MEEIEDCRKKKSTYAIAELLTACLAPIHCETSLCNLSLMIYAGIGRSVVPGNLSPRLHQLQHSTIAHGSVV
jgi:hypothetical protein